MCQANLAAACEQHGNVSRGWMKVKAASSRRAAHSSFLTVKVKVKQLGKGANGAQTQVEERRSRESVMDKTSNANVDGATQTARLKQTLARLVE